MTQINLSEDITGKKPKVVSYTMPVHTHQAIAKLSELTAINKSRILRELIRAGIDSFIAKHNLDIEVTK